MDTTKAMEHLMNLGAVLNSSFRRVVMSLPSIDNALECLEVE